MVSYSEYAVLSNGDFLIYNGTVVSYYPNQKVLQKVLLIQKINSTFPNGSILVCNILINLNSSIAPNPACSIEDPVSPYMFYYIQPEYLGKSINQYEYIGYFDNFYIYKREGTIQGVTIRGLFYFDTQGIARKVEFYQYGINGALASYTNYTLWLTNIDNRSVTFPKINYTITEITATLTSYIARTINEIILGIGSIAIILILLLRKTNS
ncbi:MAG: hypothetical protein QW250_01095 [Sulfolobaceae archaeon]